jgi:hypothetical protein
VIGKPNPGLSSISNKTALFCRVERDLRLTKAFGLPSADILR